MLYGLHSDGDVMRTIWNTRTKWKGSKLWGFFNFIKIRLVPVSDKIKHMLENSFFLIQDRSYFGRKCHRTFTLERISCFATSMPMFICAALLPQCATP